MSKQKLIILRGYPGSGKTTVGKQLQKLGIGTFIDHNAILTFIASIAGDDTGIYSQIVDLEIAICKKLLAQGQTVIVARGFSTLDSIAAYESISKELAVSTSVIRLDVTVNELKSRVKSPERKLDFNPTIDNDKLIAYMSENPLQHHPLEVVIDNGKILDEVVKEIGEAVKF